tara:strand:- start:81 stop:797 length:717 start_codon:yes stop_codon:yes gene_type:complete
MAFETKYGSSKELFGHSDYAAALLPHKESTADLQTTRNRVLDWLDQNQHLLGPKNKPLSAGGEALGLYEDISKSELHTRWKGSHPNLQSETHFGHFDLDASRAAGINDDMILAWLTENPQLLTSENVEGQAGGVFELLKGTTTDTRTSIPEQHPGIAYGTDPYVPPDPNSPTVTRNPVPWEGREDLSIERNTRDSLAINPGSNFIASKQRASIRNKARPKFTKTKDLSRQGRQSLKIS